MAEPTEASPDPEGGLSVLRWVPAAALATVLVVGARRPRWLTEDDAFYVGLADSLARGMGFVFDGAPHAVYPPGYPLTLVPAVAGWGIDPPALTLYTVVLGLAAVAALVGYLRLRGDAGSGALLATLFLGSTAVFEVFTDLRSEGVFLGVSVLLLALLERASRGVEPGARGVAWGEMAAAFALGAAVPAVRSVGVAFPLALGAALLVAWIRGRIPSARWTRAVVAALAGAAIYQLWWTRRTALHGEERSYGSLFTLVDPHQPDLGTAGPAQLAGRLLEQVAVQGGRAVEILTQLPIHPFFVGFPHLVLAVAVGIGVGAELRRPNPVAGWFFLAYLGIILLWPFDEGTRFLVPVLPFLLLFAGRGVVALARRWPQTPRGWRRVAVFAAAGGVAVMLETALRGFSRQGLLWVGLWAVVTMLASSFAVRPPRRPVLSSRVAAGVWATVYLAVGLPWILDAAGRHRAGEEKFQSQRIAAAVPWIAERTDSAAAVAATAGRAGLHLHTARRTVAVPVTADPDRLWRALDEADARTLVVPIAHPYPYLRPTGDEIVEILERTRPGRLELVHTYDMGRIFALRPPPPPPAP